MSARLATAFTHMVTDCTHNQHRYHPTWERGHVVCLDCGKRAVCPVCLPQMPDTTQQLALCATHRPKEETTRAVTSLPAPMFANNRTAWRHAPRKLPLVA
jgi:hypothetical protein